MLLFLSKNGKAPDLLIMQISDLSEPVNKVVCDCYSPFRSQIVDNIVEIFLGNPRCQDTFLSTFNP